VTGPLPGNKPGRPKGRASGFRFYAVHAERQFVSTLYLSNPAAERLRASGFVLSPSPAPWAAAVR